MDTTHDETLAWGGPTTSLTDEQIRDALEEILRRFGPGRRILAIPPDFSRFHSYAGQITAMLHQITGTRLTDVLPALGTHRAVSDRERRVMFPGIPESLFRVHDWRRDLVTLGEVPADFVQAQSEGLVRWPWPAQLNTLVAHGGHDLILSIGQVVPHEVIGMANHAKNLFVGTGGRDAINRSHYLGAVYGMERIMGRADNPVRRVLTWAAERYLADLPVVYILTVVGSDSPGGEPRVRGLFAGRGIDCFLQAAELALQVNFTMVEEAPEHVVVYLDPEEFHSTWLGNKAVYRTRMMIADSGRLTVLAPGVSTFGEDTDIDRLIRRFGYRGTPATLAAVQREPELAADMSAAAHLIHGSSEGRFTITYCPGGLTREEVEGVGFEYDNISDTMTRLHVDTLTDGWNTLPTGERVYYVSRPALGLWAHRNRFKE
jgi:nickel-dependent lactate racemase